VCCAFICWTCGTLRASRLTASFSSTMHYAFATRVGHSSTSWFVA
jgi:hypothetical protein